VVGLSKTMASWALRWCIVKASGLMSGSEASLGGRLMSGIFWGNGRCGWRCLLIIAAAENFEESFLNIARGCCHCL